MIRATGTVRIAGVFALALLLPGCAALAPDLTPPAAGAAATTAAAAPASAANPGSRSAAPAASTNDSLPSPEAQRVLATIPEPLAASERVAPPDSAVAPDTAAVHADTTQAGVPVPAPTEPLGQSSAAVDRMTSPDSALATSAAGAASAANREGAAGATGAGAAAAGAAASAGASRTPNAATASTASSSELPHGSPCFRLQVGAPSEAKKADGLKRAASSQLELEFEIAHVKNLYKVRTHDCFSREAADALKKRAVAAGFQGVFAVAATAP